MEPAREDGRYQVLSRPSEQILVGNRFAQLLISGRRRSCIASRVSISVGPASSGCQVLSNVCAQCFLVVRSTRSIYIVQILVNQKRNVAIHYGIHGVVSDVLDLCVRVAGKYLPNLRNSIN